jgi:hypothetical protein
MVPDSASYTTLCLRYSLTDKRWETYEYPARFFNFLNDDYVDAVLYGSVRYDYNLNQVIEHNIFSINETVPFDKLSVDELEYEGSPIYFFRATQPISFVLDTGQKTDSVVSTKQFVESKLVFATLDEKDSFPFTLHIAVDGDAHVTTMDVSTDAPFWKENQSMGEKSPLQHLINNSLGVVGTAFELGIDTPASGRVNTLRQLVVRYSGKGKSIRHVIEGKSQANFKLYETYVRYKNLSGK